MIKFSVIHYYSELDHQNGRKIVGLLFRRHLKRNTMFIKLERLLFGGGGGGEESDVKTTALSCQKIELKSGGDLKVLTAVLMLISIWFSQLICYIIVFQEASEHLNLS